MKTKKINTLKLDQFINQALYNKKFGYYMKKNPFGKKGDYITSPNISILFSEMIALWIILFWENLKCPNKLNLIELGSGNGEMMSQMIATFNKFPLFKRCLRINILEKSNYLKKIQKRKLKSLNIKWLKNLREVSDGPNIFVANEFFDALPIKQFIKKKDIWYERNIKFTKKNNPEFLDIKTNINKIEKKLGFKISYKQKVIEYSPLMFNYFKTISKKINIGGGMLIIDYGYLNNKMKNTLQSVFKHQYNHVLSNFGNSDITYNINFKILKKIIENINLKVAGITNQGNFLKNLGILKRAEIISKNLSFSKKASLYLRVKRLIDKNLMGDLFKVMFITKKNIKFNIGFEN